MIVRLRAGLLACVLAVTFAPGVAAANESKAAEAGIGTLSMLSSLVYGPTKLVYATCGLVFGGIAYGLSMGDQDVIDAVLTPAVRGDYVVTPAHLRREQRLVFFGEDPEYRVSQTAMVEEEPVLIEDDYSTDYSSDY